MNIRYRFKDEVTGEVYERIFSLDEIQRGGVIPWMNNGILSRDLGTGLMAKNHVEIFERDKVRDKDCFSYIITWEDGGWLATSQYHLGFRLSANESITLEIIGRSEE